MCVQPDRTATDEVVDDKHHEEEECDNLDAQTGQRDINASIAIAVRSGGDGSTGSLEHQRDNVEGDKEVNVPYGREARMLGRQILDTILGVSNCRLDR